MHFAKTSPARTRRAAHLSRLRPRAAGACWQLPAWAVAAVALLCGSGAPVATSAQPAPSGVSAKAGATANATPRTLNWDELVPKDWDPLKRLRERNPQAAANLGALREGSAGEQSLMREMRELWDTAPTRTDLHGVRVRLPGYVVPLDSAEPGKLTQFLLVPYFGACVHSPPPPANQIVQVTLKSPGNWRTMDVVWVQGVLSTQRQDSAMGVSGYALAAEVVEAYRPPAR